MKIKRDEKTTRSQTTKHQNTARRKPRSKPNPPNPTKILKLESGLLAEIARGEEKAKEKKTTAKGKQNAESCTTSRQSRAASQDRLNTAARQRINGGAIKRAEERGNHKRSPLTPITQLLQE